jgi:hypothetical protein
MREEIFVLEFDEQKKSFNLIGRYNYLSGLFRESGQTHPLEGCLVVNIITQLITHLVNTIAVREEGRHVRENQH